jgi:two-component system, chemotaxis family, protein-glutamate methylesterase/glutaminase
LIWIRQAGGVTLVQDPAEAVHPTMPRRAIAEDDVDAVLPLGGLAATLVALAEGRAVYGTHAEMRV